MNPKNAPDQADAARARSSMRLVSRIDERTGFASDFLNQFNESVMLLECIAAGDDYALDELLDWTPRSYPAHFAHSRLDDRFDIIRAYRLAERPARLKLDGEAQQISAVVSGGAAFMAACRRAGAHDSIVPIARHVAADARRRLASLDSLVHAGQSPMSPPEVSVLFAHFAA